QMAKLVHERVLPADDVAAWPPVPHERVCLGGGYQHVGIAVAAAAYLELVEALQVEAQRALRAVDFDHQPILMPGRHAGCFKGANRSAVELHGGGERIVDVDHTAGPLRGEGPGCGADRLRLANQEPRQVDHV